jgi:hypothetical protein
MAATAPNVSGSVGFTSNSIVAMKRVRAYDPASPMAKPTSTSSIV